MSHSRLKDKIVEIKDLIKKVIELKTELLRLNFLEKSSMLLGHFILLIICLLFLCFSIFAFSFALAYLLGGWINSFVLGFVIVAFGYLLLLALVYWGRYTLIINPLLRALQKLLFLDDDDEKAY